jgi:hypothetical protein
VKKEKPKAKSEKRAGVTNNQLSIINYQLICFSFLASFFLASLSRAETEAGRESSGRRFENRDVFFNSKISPEQLDPTNFLATSLAKPSQDVNTPSAIAETSQDVNIPSAIAETSQDVNTPSAIAETSQDVNTPSVIAETSQDVNTPNIPENPIQADKIPSAPQEQSQTSPDSIGITPVNSDAQVENKLPQDSPAITEHPNNLVLRQLWQARISIPKSEKDKRSKNELQHIIEQIRTVEFEPQNQPLEPLIIVEPAPTVEPNETLSKPHFVTSRKMETLSDTEVPEEPEEKEIDCKQGTPLPYGPVTSQTLQMLENLSQHPDQLDNPFELGEVLFLSDYLKEASVFYREALNRKSPDKDDQAQNRATANYGVPRFVVDGFGENPAQIN